MGKWTKECDELLKNFQKELGQKKSAIFVSSAMKSLFERQGKTEDLEIIQKNHLEDRAAKYQLHPIAKGLFGGVWDRNKIGFIFRRTLSSFVKQFEKAGFKETSPGIIDTRNIEEIRRWTKDLAKKVWNNIQKKGPAKDSAPYDAEESWVLYILRLFQASFLIIRSIKFF